MPHVPAGGAGRPLLDEAPAAAMPGNGAPGVVGFSFEAETAGSFSVRSGSLSAQSSRAVEDDGTSAWKWFAAWAGTAFAAAYALAHARERRPADPRGMGRQTRRLAGDGHGPVSPPPQTEFVGLVEEPFAGRLVEFGLTTWRELRDADPAALAFWIGAEPAMVQRWQRLARLQETVHVEPALVKALVDCGVESVEALAHADAQALWQHLKEALAPFPTTGESRGVDADTVLGWVRGAATAVDTKPEPSNQG